MLIAMLLCLAVLAAAQVVRRANRWAAFEHEMQNPVDDPPDAWEKTEFAFARLRFRSPRDGYFRGRSRWGTDTNKSDRIFMQAIRRLTRIHTRSIEEICDVDEDEMFNWPFLYAVGVGDWVLQRSARPRASAASSTTAASSWSTTSTTSASGPSSWPAFTRSSRTAKPIEIPDDHAIWQVAYDLRQRYHIPGYQIVYGQEWERGGIGGHYRAIMDEKGRIQVLICFNMDIGDAWEWADAPEYPEKYSALALRLGVNSVIYTMSH